MRGIFAIVRLLSWTGCSYQKAEMTGEIQTQLDQINVGYKPLQDFFREAEYSQLKISPNGRFIAAIYSHQGINSLATDQTGDFPCGC